MIGHSGIGAYIRGFLSGLREDQLQQMVLLGEVDKLKTYPCRTVPAPEPIYSLREQWTFPRRVEALKPDVLHVPHYNVPWLTGSPLVATVHDLNHLLFPELARRPFARLYARTLLSRLARRARKILADSERTKRDLVRFGAPAEKVKVVYAAVDETLVPPGAAETKDRLARHNLSPGYILYLGNIRKIKNVPRLLAAYEILRGTVPDAPTLVLAGEDQMPEETRPFRGRKDIRFLGPVPAEDVPALYTGAGLFVFPSLYEGFGLPPLEAMACGCPVVASTGGSLPEVLGDAALLTDPGDTEGLARAMERTLSDGGLRRALVEKGRVRAKHFSWKDSARKIFEIYEEVLSR